MPSRQKFSTSGARRFPVSRRSRFDLAAAVAVEDHDTAADRLVRQGFIDLGEADLRGRRYLRRRQPLPAANVHLMTPAGVLWIDNLVLRDYLRAAPKAARVYGDAKAAAAREHPTLLAYSQAKADFLRRLLQAAHAWEEKAALSSLGSRTASGDGHRR